MTLSVGQRVTLLKIDECLAMTHRYEMEIRKALEPEAVGYEKRNTRMAVIRQRGIRQVIETKAAAPISDNANAKIIVARGERRSATMTAWSCSTRNSTLITQLSTE